MRANLPPKHNMWSILVNICLANLKDPSIFYCASSTGERQIATPDTGRSMPHASSATTRNPWRRARATRPCRFASEVVTPGEPATVDMGLRFDVKPPLASPWVTWHFGPGGGGFGQLALLQNEKKA